LPNPYHISLNPNAELGMIIQGHASKDKQGTATYVLKLLLEKYKDEFIKMWGKGKYDELLKKYSKDIVTQKQERLLLERTKQDARKKRLELKERELNIREGNLGIRNDRSSAMKQERTKEERTIERKKLESEQREIYRSLDIIKNVKNETADKLREKNMKRLEEIHERLKQLKKEV